MTTGRPTDVWMALTTHRPQPARRSDSGAAQAATQGADPQWLSREEFPFLGGLGEVPGLILGAERYIAFKARHRLRLQASLPNQMTAPLSEAGHFPQEACPDTIVMIMQLGLRKRIQEGLCGSLVDLSRGGPEFTCPGVTVS